MEYEYRYIHIKVVVVVVVVVVVCQQIQQCINIMFVSIQKIEKMINWNLSGIFEWSHLYSYWTIYYINSIV